VCKFIQRLSSSFFVFFNLNKLVSNIYDVIGREKGGDKSKASCHASSHIMVHAFGTRICNYLSLTFAFNYCHSYYCRCLKHLSYYKVSQDLPPRHQVSYSTVVLYIGIMKVWGFWPKIITPKPA